MSFLRGRRVALPPIGYNPITGAVSAPSGQMVEQQDEPSLRPAASDSDLRQSQRLQTPRQTSPRDRRDEMQGLHDRDRAVSDGDRVRVEAGTVTSPLTTDASLINNTKSASHGSGEKEAERVWLLEHRIKANEYSSRALLDQALRIQADIDESFQVCFVYQFTSSTMMVIIPTSLAMRQ